MAKRKRRSEVPPFIYTQNQSSQDQFCCLHPTGGKYPTTECGRFWLDTCSINARCALQH